MIHSVKQKENKSSGSKSEHEGGTATRHNGGAGDHSAQPLFEQQGRVTQEFGRMIRLPLGLDERVCEGSVKALNHILADTIMLRDLYKKHHWQVSGPTFYQLHLLFDKHFETQSELIDALAERVQMLGGISLAMGADVAEETCIERPPRGREEAPAQIARLLQAHETVLRESREAAHQADESGDDGTADLLISQVVRSNELQVWFLAEHLVEAPLVQAD